jgi:hypothetical protein
LRAAEARRDRLDIAQTKLELTGFGRQRRGILRIGKVERQVERFVGRRGCFRLDRLARGRTLLPHGPQAGGARQ